VELTGTIRTFDPAVRAEYHERITRTAESIAAAAGATAEVYIGADTGYASTINDRELAAEVRPLLVAIAGEKGLEEPPLITASEDFSFYLQRVPGVFFNLGVADPAADPAAVAPNHSPRFVVDDSALLTGVRAMAGVAVAYLEQRAGK